MFLLLFQLKLKLACTCMYASSHHSQYPECIFFLPPHLLLPLLTEPSPLLLHTS